MTLNRFNTKGRIVINLVLLFFTYITPYFLLALYKKDEVSLEFFQSKLLYVIFFGALLITYLNWNYKKISDHKILWFVFMMLGILGILLSGGILLLMFSFRNGVSF